MRQITDFSDKRLKAWCIHCNGWLSLSVANRDHAPSKVLLDQPLPTNVPVIAVCRNCNSSFSPNEEYAAAFLSAVLSGTTDPTRQVTEAGSRILAGNAKLLERIERSKSFLRTAGGDEQVIWQPETERINHVAVKNARGHLFFETGEPYFAAPTYVWCLPLESLSDQEAQRFNGLSAGPEFAQWPEVGSRLMTRLLTGEDMANGWIIVQEGVYRYSIEQGGQTIVRSILREYLATEVCWTD